MGEPQNLENTRSRQTTQYSREQEHEDKNLHASPIPEIDVIKFIEKTKPTITANLDIWDHYWKTGILPLRQSIDQDAPSTIERSIHIQYSVKQFVDTYHRDKGYWNLIGHGKAYPTIYTQGQLTRPGCGFLYKDEGIGCLNHQEHKDHKILVKLITNTCMRPACPICYIKWTAREALAIEEKFRRIPKLSDNRTGNPEDRTHLGKPIHVVISPSENDGALMDQHTLEAKNGAFHIINGYNTLKQKMVKHAKIIGLKAGCAIFHPFANDELNEDIAQKVEIDPHSGEFDHKSLQNYFQTLNLKGKVWYIRPHFHLIGYGNVNGSQVAKQYYKTGWITKNLGVRTSIRETALYQLSHAGTLQGQHTVIWFGAMSNRTYHKLNPEPKRDIAQTCRYCQKPLIYVKWIGSGLSPLDTVKNSGEYKVDPPDWIEISHSEYRGRTVKPLPEETNNDTTRNHTKKK